MVQPLTKRTTSGELYTRPPEIESAIKAALALERSELLRRARIPDERAAHFLPLECLVHVIRLALQNDDVEVSNALLNALLERCAAMLMTTISDARSQRAADVRQDVLDRLVDKFLDDAKPGSLDIFEVRFSRAFRALRINALRAGGVGVELASLTDPDDGCESEPELPPTVPTQDVNRFHKELMQGVGRLPKKLRDAVALVYLMGYEIESNDSEKESAATICRVSGRTIRTRLTEAMAQLKKFVED